MQLRDLAQESAFWLDLGIKDAPDRLFSSHLADRAVERGGANSSPHFFPYAKLGLGFLVIIFCESAFAI